MMWRKHGIGVIPIQMGKKIPVTTWKVYADKYPDMKTMVSWLELFWPMGIGVVLGNYSSHNKLAVLDFDDLSGYYAWRRSARLLSVTYTVRTGRGMHAYFMVKDGERRTSTLLMHGREVGEYKSTGYVVGWPSVHESGRMYKKVGGENIKEVDSERDLMIEIKTQPRYERDLVERQPINGVGLAAKIKGEIPIDIYLLRLISNFDVMPDGSLMGKCPFHDDHRPSLQVWPSENRFYCHSPHCIAHQRSDVISACSFMYGVDMGEAVRILAKEID